MSFFGGSKKQAATLSPDAPIEEPAKPRFEPPPAELKALAGTTHFDEQQVGQLAQRLADLDDDGSGSLTADELLDIPELAMYPLLKRVLSMYNGAPPPPRTSLAAKLIFGSDREPTVHVPQPTSRASSPLASSSRR